MLHLNHKQRTKHHRRALARLLADAGGVAGLATMLNIPYITVKGWQDRGRISKRGAVLVNDNMALTEYYKPQDLRVDITPEQIQQINLTLNGEKT